MYILDILILISKVNEGILGIMEIIEENFGIGRYLGNGFFR